MKLLFDTNVLLDALLNRKPFVDDALSLFAVVEKGILQGVIGATTVTTIFYLATKALGMRAAKKTIRDLLALFEVAAVNRVVLEGALKLDFPDFEDAVLYQSAVHANLQGIITRDMKDYKKSALPIYTTSEIIQLISHQK